MPAGQIGTATSTNNYLRALQPRAAGGAGGHHLTPHSMAPVFWYLVPILGVAFVLAIFLKEIPLSEHAGMVARGEAVESEEELAALITMPDPTATVPVVVRDEDDARGAGVSV